jgi:transcriptional regulator with XRE-family HTH domain
MVMLEHFQTNQSSLGEEELRQLFSGAAQLRSTYGYSELKLAELMEIDYRQWQQLEAGHYSSIRFPITDALLQRLLRAFGCNSYSEVMRYSVGVH